MVQGWVVTQSKWNGVDITHGGNSRAQIGTLIHSRFGGVAEETDSGRIILFASLNIRSGRAGELEVALQ